nr:MAG TPA: Short C-terminal domain [Caudoviricetes sp.]
MEYRIQFKWHDNYGKYPSGLKLTIDESTNLLLLIYRTLLKLKERNGLTDDLKNKIDIFFATGRITEEQYNELMDANKEEEPKVETN